MYTSSVAIVDKSSSLLFSSLSSSSLYPIKSSFNASNDVFFSPKSLFPDSPPQREERSIVVAIDDEITSGDFTIESQKFDNELFSVTAFSVSFSSWTEGGPTIELCAENAVFFRGGVKGGALSEDCDCCRLLVLCIDATEDGFGDDALAL